MKKYFIFAILFSVIFISDCSKKNSLHSNADIDWVHVFTDSFITMNNTFDNVHSGKNAKVLTDAAGNIYIYYYAEKYNQTTYIKCSPKGNPLTKKVLYNFTPLDMVLLHNNDIIISGKTLDKKRGMKIFAFRTNDKIDSALMKPMPGPLYDIFAANMLVRGDNSIVFAGTEILDTMRYAKFGIGIPYNFQRIFFSKISSDLQVQWQTFDTLFNTQYLFQYNQISITENSNGKMVFENSLSFYTDDANLIDTNYYGLVTGVLGEDGKIQKFNYYKTGRNEYDANNSIWQHFGFTNSYSNGISSNTNNEFIYHYSYPVSLDNAPVKNPVGFLKLNENADIIDTVAIPMPHGFAITSSNFSKGNFLLTAYNLETKSNQTLFLTGRNDLQVTKIFFLQNFYTDYFSSSATAPDGSFIILGRIQSFNYPENKLTLVKLK